MSRDHAPPATRLLPGPTASVAIGDTLARGRPHQGDRPWVNLCMVSSLDGTIAVGGNSSRLGNANDTDVLHGLRRLADAVLVGAGTVRAEGYHAPAKPGQRVAVVTASGNVDLSQTLFTSGAGLLITTEGLDIDTDVEIIRAGRDHVDLAGALAELAARWPRITHVQAEGGPGLNGSLLDADLVDELDLTISPMLVGGDGKRMVTGAPEAVRRMRLEQLVTDEGGYLFGRWVRRP